MNPKPRVFLDTSVQVERLISLNQRRVAIEQIIASHENNFVTSHYVWMEFQRSVVANYVYVYNQVAQDQDWETIAYHLRAGNRSYRPRALGHCFQILTKVIDLSERNRHRALDFLRLHITQDLPRRFWRNVTPLEDQIVCDLVTIGVAREQTGLFSVADTCRKERAACHLPAFLHKEQSRLQTLTDYLKANPKSIKDQPRVERLLTAILQDNRAGLGQSACWPLGDLFILLQVPPDAMVWSFDADFQVLAEVLALKQYSVSIQ